MYPTELFIEKVKRHECLYDLSHQDYKNVYKKKVIWEEIAKDMHLNADTCKKRWKGLRDTYKRSKRAAEIASICSGREKKWKYTEAMSFLDKLSNPRAKIENVTLVARDDTFLEEDSLPKLEDYSKDGSESSECWQSPKLAHKRKAFDEITAVFTKTMNEYVEAVKEIAFPSSQTEKVRSTTSIAMELVLKRISDAKLSREQVANIENKILQIVEEEIQKYQLDFES